jgi:glycine/D-amino acid oxidase-like deaminating enzyme/nitrite reductase/ring-hydroxylating ferredoxin subunit
MTSDSGRTTSVWMSAPVPAFSALNEDVRADVCIVGAGIAGMTTAYLLTRAGKSVVVLEDGLIGGGATGRTTAHLSNALDDRYQWLARVHGVDGARLAAESHTAAVDLIESIVANEGIDCDFARVDGYLFVPAGGATGTLQEEYAAAQRAGLRDVQLTATGPFASFDTGPCLRFPRQAQFHPLKYLAALARLVSDRGGRIFTTTHAGKIEGESMARVSTNTGAVVTADALVVATNAPIRNRVILHTKQAAYRTYVIGVRIPRGSVPKVLAWDTGDPYHYLRVVESPGARDDVLLVGGEDHKTGQADDTEQRFARLTAWARARFPEAVQVDYHWSGQIMEPVDGLAFIGRNPMDAPHVYVATGDSGNGMTHGTVAGMLLTDLIVGRRNRWSSLYDPSRKRLRAAKDFASENANVVAQYAAWVTAGEATSVEQIARGSGAVMRRGMHKVAVYRDDAGALHTYKATCPHLGCIVEWNRTERTWDCPCHGSRFDAHGHIINGPANVDLTPEPSDFKKTG